jgi:tetratricopeptide (TPR) repeat protein
MTTPEEAELRSEDAAEPRPEEQPVVAARKRPMDPVAVTLWMSIGIVVILALVTVVAGILMNVMGTGAPKTMDEFTLTATRARIDAGSKDGSDWVNYILALTKDGQYQEAQDWIDQGNRTLKNQEVSADMLYVQANLYVAQGQLDKALRTADQGLKIIKATHDAAYEKWKKTQVPTEAAVSLHANYWELLLLKANAYEKKKDWKNAVKAYDTYLAEKTMAATVFTQRGVDKEKMGDKKGAEADFRQTLKFIPDNAEALAGLKRIGAGK